jgi:hypothetical protein
MIGGADGIRTHDLLDAIEARSQLRHGPTGEPLCNASIAGNLRPEPVRPAVLTR